MVVYNLKCEICHKKFKARRRNNAPPPKYCGQACYSIRMKQKWNDETYRKDMVQKHLDNPTKYWLGKKRPDMQGSNNPRWKEVKGSYIDNGYNVLYRPDFVIISLL